MYKLIYYFRIIQNWIIEKTSTSKIDVNWDNAIIFMLACDYNNVGDMLIREAQQSFLLKNSNGKEVIVVSFADSMKYLKNIYRNATPNTIIVLTGGGDTDDRYTSMERYRNRIIKKLAKNGSRIIGFPQTIDYSNTKRGKFYKRKTQKAYSSNKNFVFFAREKISYEIAKQLFPNNKVKLAPDIVLSYSISDNKKQKRSGIGTLLRHDEEKKIDVAFQESLLNELTMKYGSIEENDMTIVDFYSQRIKQMIKEKVEFVRKKKVIITDRLHGMILCYITNTPCVVFSNSNHKIIETFNNWLKDTQNFVILEKSNDIRKVTEDIQGLMALAPTAQPSLETNYQNLIELIMDKTN